MRTSHPPTRMGSPRGRRRARRIRTALDARRARRALAFAVIPLIAGCGDDIQGPRDLSTDLLSTLIVSNSVTAASPVAADAGDGEASSADGIVYVSLPPGSVPEGETVVVRTRGTDAVVTASMVDGGFDPVPLAATTGDTLDVRIELAAGGTPLQFHAPVPGKAPPVVVRTDPPPRKRDVPLNAVMLVVFSEPIDAETLTPSSVELLLDGIPVDGTLRFEAGSNLRATFAPAERLAPEAEYSLLVTQEIEDLDGEALAESVTTTFTTGTGPGDPGAVNVWTLFWVLPDLPPHYVYYWSGPGTLAERLTVSRISAPAAVVWEIVAESGAGFCGYQSDPCTSGGAVAHGFVPLGANTVVEPVEPVVRGSGLYRLTITFTDGRAASLDFNNP